jgi:predicted PurR-regulated permease PerM
VSYILIAAIFSLIGQPLVKLLSKVKIRKLKISQSLSAGITLLVIWVLIFTFFRIFVPIIANQASDLSSIDANSFVEKLEQPIEKLEDILGQFNSSEEAAFSFEDYIREKIVSVLKISYLSDFLNFIVGTLGDIFIAIFAISFISFFFLKDDKLFFNGIFLFIPENIEENVRNIIHSVQKLLIRYFIGIGIEVCLIMILITIGLSIVGLKLQTALVIGLFVGLMNIIPYVGPIIGAAFGIILGIATNLDANFYTELLPMIGYMAIVFISVQLIDNVFFQPLIYSNSVNAHPLEIFLVIMMAGSLAGITGMVLAIPAYTILRVIAKEFFNQFSLVKKLTKNV